MLNSRRRLTKSLVFLHIPKTGGTSLIKAIQSNFSDRHCYTDSGNITLDLLSRHIPLPKCGNFFYGHPFHGSIGLMDTAQTITVLRDPEEHAISNYLYLQREANLPLHRAAQKLAFPMFLRTHWACLVFQAVSLDVGLSDRPIRSKDEFFNRLPAITALLDRINFVGCLDRIDELMHVLVRARGWSRPKPIPHLHSGIQYGVNKADTTEMRRQYRQLRFDPDTCLLMAAEEAIYNQACRIARRQLAESQQQSAPRSIAYWLPAQLRRVGRSSESEISNLLPS